jgi:hypothetical protein
MNECPVECERVVVESHISEIEILIIENIIAMETGNLWRR